MNVGHNIIQLGSDPDPAKNFIIRTPPVQDGTLEIRKGTLEAPGALVATFNGDGLVDPREWLGVTPQRAFGTTYVNDTPMDIIVYVTTSQAGLSANIWGVVEDQMVQRYTNFSEGLVSLAISFTVPPGKAYSVQQQTDPILALWREYRIPEGV